MSEIAQRFCSTQARADLFRGWVAYRAALTGLGFNGRQWVDGSFCEDCEAQRKRPPADIDLVSLVVPQLNLAPNDLRALVTAHPELFSREQTKRAYHCDAFFLDMRLPAFAVHAQLTYWYGLLTHQRVSHLWKGMLQVELRSDDAAALALLNNMGFPPAP